ncbi:PmoA family protein [Kolteria novifilia]|uniref:DUF6807 domain-containing protein n=1 Tax=Kolteria novifilia TaxID=2527975 RepID=UPI003AF3C563
MDHRNLLSRSLRLPAFAAALVLLLSPAARADHEVVVTNGEHELLDAPVTAVLPKGLAGKSVRLVADDGKPVVSQSDKKEGKPALTWIIPKIAPKQTLRYKLVPGEAATAPAGEGVEIKETGEGVEITINGKLFTVYRTKKGVANKPYWWPIIGPTGKPVTRAYPMVEGAANERDDHHHHRSLWFTHEDVSGENYWHEVDKAASTVHQEIVDIQNGPVFGEFTARTDWIDTKGNKTADDIRTMRVYNVPDARLMDVMVTVNASQKELVWGDRKDGMFGVRVAGTMKVDAKKGGTIRNANGVENKEAWGKRAPWCDYFGPLEGETVGIAIFDKPTNLRHPTYWHVRTYGLFTANPFGIGYFKGDRKKYDGTYVVPKGDQLRFDYRIYIHKGDTEQAHVGDVYAAYADPPEVVVK